MPDKQDIFSQIDQLFGVTGEPVNYDQLFKKPEAKQPSDQMTYDDLFTQPAQPLQPEQGTTILQESQKQSVVDRLLKAAEIAVLDENKYKYSVSGKQLGILDKWRDLVRRPTQTYPFISSLQDVRDIGELIVAANRIENNEYTQDDINLWKNFNELQEVDKTFGYQVLETVTHALPFMGELAITAGLFGAGRKASIEASKALINKYAGKYGKNILAKKATQLAIKGIGTAVGAAPQTVTARAPAIVAGTLERRLPEVELLEKTDGKIEAEVDRSEVQPIPEAMVKAFVDQYIETFSEQTGGALTMGLKSKVIKNLTKGARDIAVKSALIRSIVKLNKTATYQSVKKALELAGYHGVLEEVFEERVGDVMRGVAKELGIGDDAFRFPTLEQLGVEFTSFAIPGVVSHLASAGGEKVIKTKREREVRKVTRGVTFEQYEKEELQQLSDSPEDKLKAELLENNPRQYIFDQINELQNEKDGAKKYKFELEMLTVLLSQAPGEKIPIKKEKPVEPEITEPETFEQYKEAELKRVADEEDKVKQLTEQPIEYIQDQIRELDQLIAEEKEIADDLMPERERLIKHLEELNASRIRETEGEIPKERVQREVSEETRSDVEQLAAQKEAEQVPGSVPRVRQEEEKELRKPTEKAPEPIEIEKVVEETTAKPEVEERKPIVEAEKGEVEKPKEDIYFTEKELFENYKLSQDQKKSLTKLLNEGYEIQKPTEDNQTRIFLWNDKTQDARTIGHTRIKEGVEIRVESRWKKEDFEPMDVSGFEEVTHRYSNISDITFSKREAKDFFNYDAGYNVPTDYSQWATSKGTIVKVGDKYYKIKSRTTEPIEPKPEIAAQKPIVEAEKGEVEPPKAEAPPGVEKPVEPKKLVKPEKKQLKKKAAPEGKEPSKMSRNELIAELEQAGITTIGITGKKVKNTNKSKLIPLVEKLRGIKPLVKVGDRIIDKPSKGMGTVQTVKPSGSIVAKMDIDGRTGVITRGEYEVTRKTDYERFLETGVQTARSGETGRIKNVGMQEAEPYKGVYYFIQRGTGHDKGRWRAFNYGEQPLETKYYSGKDAKQKAIDDIKTQIDRQSEQPAASKPEVKAKEEYGFTDEKGVKREPHTVTIEEFSWRTRNYIKDLEKKLEIAKAKKPYSALEPMEIDNQIRSYKISLYAEKLEHKRLIKQALSEGKPVPKEVLADYPELTKPGKKELVKPAEKVAEQEVKPEPTPEKTGELTENEISILKQIATEAPSSLRRYGEKGLEKRFGVDVIEKLSNLKNPYILFAADGNKFSALSGKARDLVDYDLITGIKPLISKKYNTTGLYKKQTDSLDKLTRALNVIHENSLKNQKRESQARRKIIDKSFETVRTHVSKLGLEIKDRSTFYNEKSDLDIVKDLKSQLDSKFTKSTPQQTISFYDKNQAERMGKLIETKPNGDVIVDYQGNRITVKKEKIKKTLKKPELAEKELEEEIQEQRELPDEEKIQNAVEKKYGLTNNIEDAGYITKDGEFIDLKRSRISDYLRHGDVYDLESFMNMGNIRLQPEDNAIEMFFEPTLDQYGALRKFIKAKKGEIQLEMREGIEDPSKLYDRFYERYEIDTTPDIIIRDIKNWYKTKTKRPKSLVQKFHKIQEMRELPKEETIGSLEIWNREAIELLSKSIRGIKVIYTSIPEFEKAYKETKRYKQRESAGSINMPLGFFSPTKNAIYINPRKANRQTIFHEFAHPLMNWIKKEHPGLYAEGLNALKGTEYEKHITKHGVDEAIVYAIGDKGAQIQDQVKRNKFLAWMKKVWMKARIAFKRLFNINLSLDEFTSMISYAMRRGEPIMPAVKKKLVKPQFMYAGERAKWVDFGNLERAKAMEYEGQNKESVRQATGWFRGPDKLWRFEIDDNEMKLKFARPEYDPDYWNQDTERFEKKFSGRLGDIIKHDKLFEAYPELIDIRIYATINENFESGGELVTKGFNLADSHINIQAPNEQDLRESLAHEIQHWIQFYEGFAKGSNLTLNLESVDHYRTLEESLRLTRIRIEDNEKILKDNSEQLSTTEKQKLVDQIDASRSFFSRTWVEFTKMQQRAIDRYRRSAGEFEARDVSSRIDMPKNVKFLVAPYSSEELDFKDLIINMTNPKRAMLMPDMEDPFITEMREKYHAGAYEDQSEFLQTLAKEKRHFSEVARAKKYWNEIVADKVEMPKKAPFDLPVETHWQWIQRKIQDKYNRATQVIKKAEKKGERIGDELDFRQEMELYIGRASDQIENFQKQITNGKDGFLERLTDSDHTWQDLSLFMYARHAQERNETIRERDPENDAGSGMTDKDSQDILDEFQDTGIQVFADEYYETVTKPTLDILYDSGLISEKEYESYTQGWKYYVPLKGIDRQEQFRLRGKGFSVEYKGIIKAKGRHSLAENNPFIQAIMDHEDAIIRAEKNKVGQSFLDFVLSHRSPMWKVEGRKKLPTYNKHGEIEYFRLAKQHLADNELAVWVEGKQKVVTIYDTPLLNGLKNLGIEKGWKYLNKINHYLRLVNTMLNPEFIISNFERDLQTALINLSSEDTKKLRRKVLKDLPGAMKGIWKDIRDKDGNNWTDIFKEFRKEGGKTGWFDYRSLDEKTEDFENKIRKYKRQNKPLQVFNATKQFVFDINEMVENGIRVSAYKNAIESGMTKKQAANLAKNLTINFNKKGELGGFMNSLYLFANAGVQGGARLLMALKHKRVRRVGYGLILMSLLADTLSRLFGGDDYEKIDDYIKDTNWIFMLPNGKHLRIRLPYGYNVFNVAGLAISEVLHGGDPLKQGGRILSNIVDAFNPMGKAGSPGQLISPTAGDIVVQLWENKNFFGAPIAKEQPAYAPKIPESQRYFRSVNPYTRAATSWLNKVTGGSERERGLIDVSPEYIDHVFDFIGGGTGKFITRSIGVPWTLISEGKFPPPEKIPFVRQVYGERSEWMDFKKINEYISESGRKRFSKKEVRDFMTSLNQLYEERKITKENYKRKKSLFFNSQNKLKSRKRLIKK